MKVVNDALNTITHDIQQVSNHNNGEQTIWIVKMHARNRLLIGRIQAEANATQLYIVHMVGIRCVLQTNMYKHAISSVVPFNRNI